MTDMSDYGLANQSMQAWHTFSLSLTNKESYTYRLSRSSEQRTETSSGENMCMEAVTYGTQIYLNLKGE